MNSMMFNTLKKTGFIPSEYAAAIVINPTQLSTETLLAMEQYVLNGGSLIISANQNLRAKAAANPLYRF